MFLLAKIAQSVSVNFNTLTGTGKHKIVTSPEMREQMRCDSVCGRWGVVVFSTGKISTQLKFQFRFSA
ncbi:MAG: hypothetical protein WA782_08745, partial [Sulfitobacter sp.]